MTTLSDYDQQVKQINAQNQPIFVGFENWLDESGLTRKTIENHIVNMSFFSEYLVYYDPLIPLNESDAGDVLSFLIDWFPRKAMWSSPSASKSYMTTFRKFYKFMVETGLMDKDVEDGVREALKEEKDEILDAVRFDDDW
ncbi:MAG: integrase [Chloroflexota bacterium]